MKTKRVVAALLALVCAFSLFACAAETTTSSVGSVNYTLASSKRAYTATKCAYCATEEIVECVCDCHHSPNALMCATCAVSNCVVAERDVSFDRYEKWPVTIIGKNSFKGCVHVHTLKMSDYVTTIESSAFESCNYLKSVELGNGVTMVESKAFSNCTKLSELVIGENVTTIRNAAFEKCTSLRSVDLSSVVAIEASAFDECSNLSVVILGNSIRSIGQHAFYEDDYGSSAEFFFEGTEEEWLDKCEAIDKNGKLYINANMADLITSFIYYYSETKPAYSSYAYYWHYDVNGQPVAW